MALLISPLIKRALFRVLIPTYVRQGMSMNAMIRDAKRLELSYARTEMLAEIRYFMGWFVNEAKSRSLPRDERVPIHLMEDVLFSRSRRYRVFGDATYEHPVTKETFIKNVSLYDNVRRSPDLWENKMIDAIEEDPSQPGWNLVNVDFRVAEHNKGWTY